MKLRGDVLKKIRRKRGLSQTALAEGICTQATISLMEKQNRLPKMNILTAICERLNIPTERIVENNGNGINDQFNIIVNDLVSGKFESAAEALDKIPVKKLESDFDKQRYYYLLGMVQVNSDKIDEAIFNFELVLTQFATTSANIYLAMTTAGMALAYYKRNDPERAQRLTDRAVRLIDNKKLIGSLHQWASIYYQLGQLYGDLGNYKDSKEIVNRGIELCRQHDSLFILDELYLIRGKDELALGEKEQAKESLEIARSISLARRESFVKDEIAAELAKLKD
ncbi:helix-turn-helix domain-containing protein [Limosilactobacillus sp. Sa3CUN2]|uniref:Helix-turn-helix domain-containing protein n=1 Tax=Limosilactobacillus avistercoris TaxID=2762243 RepID=A0ABR8PC86_9LACO|nr:helix-turn-helix domain-containing protein [Limosilactobacillus avistercoris]MBD7894902.1 helix-turn-helix domain-containing protein [Limosilactobacillus avistercoris]